jgi:hypothetical protein
MGIATTTCAASSGSSVPKRSFSLSQETRAKQILEALPEFEATSGVCVFVGGLAFESEKLRRAAGKRFLSLDLRGAAHAGVELL